MKGIAVVVLLLAAGLSVLLYLVTRPPERGLTAAELAWVRSYHEWRDDRWDSVVNAYNGLGSSESLASERALLEPLRSCSSSYARRVGPAPGPLGAVENATEDACTAAERSVEQIETLGDSGLGAARSALLEAVRAFDGTERRLGDHLLVLRPLPTVEGVVNASRVEPRLSEAATRVSGIPMKMRCWSRGDWTAGNRELRFIVPNGEKYTSYLGAAGIWDGAPNLSPRACDPLARFVYGIASTRVTAGVAQGLATLGHELAHASGTVDEAETECRGIQKVRRLARLLGASAAQAGGFATRAWRNFQASETLLPEYWSPKCRDGGPWDERATGPWP